MICETNEVAEKNIFFRFQCDYKRVARIALNLNRQSYILMLLITHSPVVNLLTVSSAIIYSIKHPVFPKWKKKEWQNATSKKSQCIFNRNNFSWQHFFFLGRNSVTSETSKYIFVFVEDSNLHKQLKTKLKLLFFFLSDNSYGTERLL